jgi:succinate dehydrogenase / fumarate reductase, flavoprotein subunit
VADDRMQTEVPGLLVAGEAVGGANGANRLSGNAISEAFVFGRRAGRSAAERAKQLRGQRYRSSASDEALDLIQTRNSTPGSLNTAAMVQTLQNTMTDDVGPFRTRERLARALATIHELTVSLGQRPCSDGGVFDMQMLEWFDLRNMLLVARAVTQAAFRRTESRGAHQREDFPGLLPEWNVNQVVRLNRSELSLSSVPIAHTAAAQ